MLANDTQGTFGDNTASAVVQFQGKYNIRQTGTVGPLTRAKLNSLYGCGTKPLPTNCTSGQTLGCNVGNGAGLMTCNNGQWSSCVVTPNPTPISSTITVTLTASGGSQTPTIQSGSSIDLRWASTNANKRLQY